MVFGILACACALVQPQDPSTLTYEGSYRQNCKTTMLQGQPQTYDSVAALRQTLLDDKAMRKKYPHLKSQDSRTPEESHVVTVTANLYAYAFEKQAPSGKSKMDGDNDFHLIVGDDGTNPSTLLNVEVSGLPNSGDPDGSFTKARQHFLAILSKHHLTTPAGYHKLKTPIQVQITGSLFYDEQHGPGKVGTGKLKPSTAWEIHPVQEISEAPPQSLLYEISQILKISM